MMTFIRRCQRLHRPIKLPRLLLLLLLLLMMRCYSE